MRIFVSLMHQCVECSRQPATSTDGNGDGDGDEPEAAVLLIACGIGLLTGSGVVLFNVAIHAIQVSNMQAL